MGGLIGLWVVLGAVVLAVAFGGYRHLTDGRPRNFRGGAASLDAGRLGAALGRDATLVQFSAAVCAPCRATHRVLHAVAAGEPAVAHIDIDAETRLDLVEELGITRTPTVLLLDGDGVVRSRIVGAPRTPEVLDALQQVVGRPAA